MARDARVVVLAAGRGTAALSMVDPGTVWEKVVEQSNATSVARVALIQGRPSVDWPSGHALSVDWNANESRQRSVVVYEVMDADTLEGVGFSSPSETPHLLTALGASDARPSLEFTCAATGFNQPVTFDAPGWTPLLSYSFGQSSAACFSVVRTRPFGTPPSAAWSWTPAGPALALLLVAYR